MKPMHPLRQILHSTTRLECEQASGEVAYGTGFYINLAEKNSSFIPVIITNKHVIHGAVFIRFPVTCASGDGLPESFVIITIPINKIPIFPHPDPNIDLVGIPIGPLMNELDKSGKRPYIPAFPKEFIVDDSYMSDLYPMEEVIMIGYPNSIWDSHNNLPVIRKGIIASDPGKNYNGKDEFICDIAAFPGSSGSPVMLCNYGSYLTKDGNMAMGSRIKLLGILYAGPQHTATGEIQVQNIPTTQREVAISRIPNNIGIMIKSKKLLEIESLLYRLHPQ